ncbi:MAG: Flp pilus assembly complex ATPase component TadA, partial [Candidatus Omnitrophica bacterium]|nr:Flp pilus assembly complex ATPase component TadA [Candidatus Omnitrophota bacterium]
MANTLKDRIIQVLKDKYSILGEDIDNAIFVQKKKGISLGKALVEAQLIKEEQFLSILVEEFGVPFINLGKYKIDPSLKEIINERIARQYNLVPLSSLGHSLTVALFDPLNIFIIDDLKNLTGKEIDVVMSTETDIQKAIDNFYGSKDAATVKEIAKDIDAGDFTIVDERDVTENIDGVVGQSEEAPIIRIVNLIIKEAIKQRSSDIHIEPMAESIRVRFRVDGVLHDVFNLPKDNQNAVTVRLKILSRIDITSSQVPQDGRFKLRIGSKEIDFRVSMLPTIFGQKIVLRILDKVNLSVGLDGLGFTEKSLVVFKEAVRKPFGMILVTGPTGSGKS